MQEKIEVLTNHSKTDKLSLEKARALFESGDIERIEVGTVKGLYLDAILPAIEKMPETLFGV